MAAPTSGQWGPEQAEDAAQQAKRPAGGLAAPRERDRKPTASDRLKSGRRDPPPPPISGPHWEAPELLYIKFTSKDQTLILAAVLKGKSELPGFY